MPADDRGRLVAVAAGARPTAKASVNALARRLVERITADGPISVAAFMNAALYDPDHGYYATRTLAAGPGVGGDFLTAPEISQMFGELIGAWVLHEWRAMGAPSPCWLIELGPGKGLLIADAWRAIGTDAEAKAALQIHLVEISPTLTALQTAELDRVGAQCRHHRTLDDVPAGPGLIIANEFLDCMAIRQFVRTAEGWRERLVGVRNGVLAFGLAPGPLRDFAIPVPAAETAPLGGVVEIAPALAPFVATLAQRLLANPGRALCIDYGPALSSLGDTLQAVKAHQKVDPLATPGEADLTAHVDFSALRSAAVQAGLAASAIITQSDFLLALGIEARAARLSHSRPDQAERIARQMQRLVHPNAMGGLFKALCLSSPDLSPPAAF